MDAEQVKKASLEDYRAELERKINDYHAETEALREEAIRLRARKNILAHATYTLQNASSPMYESIESQKEALAERIDQLEKEIVNREKPNLEINEARHILNTLIDRM